MASSKPKPRRSSSSSSFKQAVLPFASTKRTASATNPGTSKPTKAKQQPISIRTLSTEQKDLNSFLDDHVKKGYIHPSKSPMASPFFFIKKKDGKLRPVQDYCALNKGTIKNEYPLPLISELVDKLKGAKVFSKMDVRWGYNNVRIKEECYEVYVATLLSYVGL
ncbi:hypothetical protein EWM64_g1841 [Hericium alpestre]|uniref:Reverse transcriptase domain-containing protein n=1 Tax=Hericium alpestre TaxID=135208 RepID=A0A4Z0A747_9AGAM|nr:hypothetical protein EWM64_g1841 [Hericium alpestre]